MRNSSKRCTKIEAEEIIKAQEKGRWIMDAFIALISSLLSFFYTSKPTVKPHQAKRLLKFISKKLPQHGILRKDTQGMVYVTINNNYIYKLIQFIQGEGFEAPPYFGKGKHGAHITVMPMDEVLYHAVGEIKECGKAIQFEPKECQIIHPEAWKSGDGGVSLSRARPGQFCRMVPFSSCRRS